MALLNIESDMAVDLLNIDYYAQGPWNVTICSGDGAEYIDANGKSLRWKIPVTPTYN